MTLLRTTMAWDQGPDPWRVVFRMKKGTIEGVLFSLLLIFLFPEAVAESLMDRSSHSPLLPAYFHKQVEPKAQGFLGDIT